jgi:hypothetical protein
MFSPLRAETTAEASDHDTFVRLRDRRLLAKEAHDLRFVARNNPIFQQVKDHRRRPPMTGVAPAPRILVPQHAPGSSIAPESSMQHARVARRPPLVYRLDVLIGRPGPLDWAQGRSDAHARERPWQLTRLS